jgi:heterodisulfide reductase subunit A-like polyferredoxin
MMDAGRHPRIEILTCAEVVALEGEAGRFEATVRCHATQVDRERCTGCGDCAEVCPVIVPNAFDVGLGGRHAIFRPFPQAVPATFAIDPGACLNDGRLIACEACRRACQRDAIDLERAASERRLHIGAVIVATGFDEFDPTPLRNYGYGVYPNVVTSLELERLLNASGPTLGHVMRPSDRRPPRRLVYVQCVGSRGEAGHSYCSRFCCMNAAKDGLLLKQHEADLEAVTILYSDVRACGKGFEEFYERARATDWIEFVRGRPGRITEVPGTHDLDVAVEDTETGGLLHLAADLVVLSCGGVPAEGTAELAARLGIELAPSGFLAAGRGVSPVATSRPGIFTCGSATGPQVVPECVAQGSAAAAEAAILLLSARAEEHREDVAPAAAGEDAAPAAAETGKEGGMPAGLPDGNEDAPQPASAAVAGKPAEAVRAGSGIEGPAAAMPRSAGDPVTAQPPTERRCIYPDEMEPDRSAAGEPRIGVFLCHCGVNIAGVLAMPELLACAGRLPGVIHVSEELFACSSTSQKAIQEAIAEKRLNRVVVAACTPRTHEPIFRHNCSEAGLNPFLLEMVNLRDQCSWVHAALPGKATEKAHDLLRMAVARARHLEPLCPTEAAVEPRVLVVGAGLAGLKAASDLASFGFEVTLIDREARAGGQLAHLDSLYAGSRDTRGLSAALIDRARESGVTVLLGREVRSISGFVGNFRVELGPAGSGPAGEQACAPEADSRPREAASVEGGAADAEILTAGAIVVAIGAQAYAPQESEYGYGRLPNVITSVELESRLARGAAGLAGVASVAFIQCVGSRQDPGSTRGIRGCSRVCCPTTVRQALALEELGIDALVCYRDMRMVGPGAEEAYREARAGGITFLRFRADAPPQVIEQEGRVAAVRMRETLLRREVEASVDLVVLAVGLAARAPEAARVQEMLKTPRGEDGFFLERHPELAPVETCVDGVVLCGAALGPQDPRGALVQASAAAARVAALLGKGRLFLDPAVCRVDAGRCRGCGLCVSICQFQAPTLEAGPEGLTARINPALCKGCGTCAVWCPTNAIRAAHFTDEQITAMIDSLFSPKVRQAAGVDGG